MSASCSTVTTQNVDLIGRVFKDETTEYFTALARKVVYAFTRGLSETG